MAGVRSVGKAITVLALSSQRSGLCRAQSASLCEDLGSANGPSIEHEDKSSRGQHRVPVDERGVVPFICPKLSAQVAPNPNGQVRIAEGFSALLTERVRAGEYAFAIVPAFRGAPGLDARLFHSTPEVLVSRRTPRRAHMTPVRLKEVGPLNLLLPSPPNTRRRTLDTYLASNGVRVRQALEIDSMFGALDLIANSDWVSIFPAS